MTTSLQQTSSNGHSAGGVEEFDVVVIGAGVTGLYSLYRLRHLGFSVRSLEEGDGVGGTWYWNRYPGARFDSESYTYGYSFSEELLQEWEWQEHYSGQPENERYLNYVADKFDLRRDIRFNSRVASLVYDEAGNQWQITTDDGYQARAQFVITAIGILSARYVPEFEGLESYEGRVDPHQPVAQGRHGPGGQARWRHRHRRHGRPADPGDRRRSRPPDGLPADCQLLRAPAQRRHRPGDAGLHQVPLPGDFRAVPGHPRLLHARV